MLDDHFSLTLVVCGNYLGDCSEAKRRSNGWFLPKLTSIGTSTAKTNSLLMQP